MPNCACCLSIAGLRRLYRDLIAAAREIRGYYQDYQDDVAAAWDRIVKKTTSTRPAQFFTVGGRVNLWAPRSPDRKDFE